jgi:hypothetical protein
MSYRDVQKRGRTILGVVERRYMPPWHPEPGHGEFQGERRLSDRQVHLLRRWVKPAWRKATRKNSPKSPSPRKAGFWASRT